MEFALVFPLFILLVAAMIDFGVGLFSYMSVVNAVRDGGAPGGDQLQRAGVHQPGRGPRQGGVRRAGAVGDVTVSCTKAAGGTVACTKNTVLPPGAQNGVKNGDTITVTAQYTLPHALAADVRDADPDGIHRNLHGRVEGLI